MNRISVVVMPQGISSAHPAHPWIPKAGSPSKPDFLIKFIQTVVYGCIRKCAHNFYDFPGQRASPTRQTAQPARAGSSASVPAVEYGINSFRAWDLILQLCYAGCFSHAHCILHTYTHIAFWSFGVVKSALRVTTNCIDSTGCHVLGARHLFDP